MVEHRGSVPWFRAQGAGFRVETQQEHKCTTTATVSLHKSTLSARHPLAHSITYDSCVGKAHTYPFGQLHQRTMQGTPWVDVVEPTALLLHELLERFQVRNPTTKP